MRTFLFAAIVLLLSCGQNTSKDKTASVKKDTVSTTADTVIKQPDKPIVYTAPGEAAVNEALQSKWEDKWHVLNDQEAHWMKDAFDYFIAPKRKEQPDYPYITQGDFNGDGKRDTAAVVTDDKKKEFRIAILLGNGKIQLWEEDVLMNAALTTVPKGSAVEGGDMDHPKKIKMKIDGINVEYFEQASFVIYQSGNSFKRIQTGD